MTFWTKRRSWQLVAVILIVATLGLVSALAVYAASTDARPSVAPLAQAQQGGTPSATLAAPSTDSPVSQEGAELAVLQGTEEATATATITPTVPPPTATPTPILPGNVITNGGFENGFVEGQGVGVGWGRFDNGNGNAGWYDDTWFKVVYEGEHAQLLELRDNPEPDRYVGIFQTVTVVPDAEYVLTLHGLVRSDEGSVEASNYGYRMQYGIDLKGGTDWQSSDVTWVELPWDEQPRQDPTGQNVYRMESYTTTVKTEGDKLTLFIRGWKKWPGITEGNYDIDGVSLVGPRPLEEGGAQPTATPVPPGMPETGDAFAFLENPVLVVASAALLVVLAGGAVLGLSRRRP